VAKISYSVLLKKGDARKGIRHELQLDPLVKAPIEVGQPIGKLVVYRGAEVLTDFTVESPLAVSRASWWTLLRRTTGQLFLSD
jgi:D-alanyl-D-alanine carboxypeptidase (penicillin-binding protein 5/6)